jgi:hypothetical protein
MQTARPTSDHSRNLVQAVAIEIGWRRVATIDRQELWSGDCPACGAPGALAWDFRTNRNDNAWACWSCREHGTIYQLWQRVRRAA